jgi:hypothetical protein
MNRRHFIALSGTASVAALTSNTTAAETASDRDIYELRQYAIASEAQKKGLDGFFKNAAIPALNRLGIKPVGVFYPSEGISPIYVLVRHPSMESILTMGARLAGDSEFISAGSSYIEATAGEPAYKRVESSILFAFKGMPRIERPVTNAGRVFQLRIYESPSEVTGLKKIEMFNDAGEISIFREVGLNPVFFGQAIAGAKMPNLTYMLAFKSKEEQDAAWKKFIAHPEWKRLSKMPEYSDKAILSGITNLQLVAADYSQI